MLVLCCYNSEMRFKLFSALICLFVFSSCEEEKKLEDHIYKTWDMEWKRCGVYLNAYDGKIHFNETDSVDDGWFVQQGHDTVWFQFLILNNSQLQILESNDSSWLGIIDFEEFGTTRISFERQLKECDKELWRFN